VALPAVKIFTRKEDGICNFSKNVANEQKCKYQYSVKGTV
jgi:hypothetical protein